MQARNRMTIHGKRRAIIPSKSFYYTHYASCDHFQVNITTSCLLNILEKYWRSRHLTEGTTWVEHCGEVRNGEDALSGGSEASRTIRNWPDSHFLASKMPSNCLKASLMHPPCCWLPRNLYGGSLEHRKKKFKRWRTKLHGKPNLYTNTWFLNVFYSITFFQS